MTYILDIDLLNVGDIVLSAQKSLTSKSVRLGTLSEFSHVLLCVGHGSYIHADAEGVHSRNFQRLLFTNVNNAKVLRLKEPVAAVIEEAVRFARNEVGKQYSVKEAARTILPQKAPSVSNRQFCSRLVAKAFEAAGCALVQDASYCTPDDISKSPKLQEVAGVLRPAAEVEKVFATSVDPMEEQTRITNKIFNEVRTVTKKDIQTFEQLINHLTGAPEHDDAIAEIIKASGYLDLWKMEAEKNPWRYDIYLFSHQICRQGQGALKAAQQEEKGALELMNHWGEVRDQYLALYEASRLETARVLSGPYEALMHLQNKRLIASRAFLSNISAC